MTSDDNKNIKQNSEPKKNMFGLEIMPDLEANLSEAKKKSIKLWLIIGTVLLPLILFTGRAIINFDGVAFLFLLIYLGQFLYVTERLKLLIILKVNSCSKDGRRLVRCCVH